MKKTYQRANVNPCKNPAKIPDILQYSEITFLNYDYQQSLRFRQYFCIKHHLTTFYLLMSLSQMKYFRHCTMHAIPCNFTSHLVRNHGDQNIA